MGLETRERSNYTYVKASQGWITRKPEENDPEEHIRTFEYPTGEVRRMCHASISGMITGMELKKGEYGPKLQIYLQDGVDTFCFSMRPDSQEAFGFYNRMLAIDYSKPVKFVHWKPKDDQYYKLLTMQEVDGEWKMVGYSFKMDEAPKWDYDPVMEEWNRKPAMNYCLKAMEKAVEQIALHGNTAKKKVEEPVGKDDLPF